MQIVFRSLCIMLGARAGFFVITVFMFSAFTSQSTDDKHHGELQPRMKRYDVQLLRAGIKNGIKAGKWLMRLRRVQRAKVILKADATLWKKEKDMKIDWYYKQGGEERARKDFWMANTYGTRFTVKQQEKYIYQGTIGDSTLTWKGRFSKKLPFPALILMGKNSPETTRGTVTIVLYKN